MKKDISSLELHYLMKELDHLISAKVEQIYQIGGESLILQLHVPRQGKQILRVLLGKMMYLASNKGTVPEKPHGFCLFLRRRLKNARLRSLQQMGFERIVEFVFETKEQKFKLIIELFSKGNIILTDEQGKILSVLERKEWKDRSLKPGQVFACPKNDIDFLTLSFEQLESLLHSSDKENVVKTLALDLSLGGTYAEEICLLAGVDKNLKSAQLSDKEAKSLFDSAVSLRDKAIEPMIVFADQEGSVKDVVPFPLQSYGSLASESYSSYNTALDSVFTEKIGEKAIESAEKVATTKIDKVNEMISQQTQRIEGLEVSEKDNQRKGELIYENYPLVQQVLTEINELKKTMSWKDIQTKFKGHKLIKDINPTTGDITLEL